MKMYEYESATRPKTSCETYILDFARRNHGHNRKLLFPTRLIQQHSQGRARAMRGGSWWTPMEATTIPTDHAVFNNTVPPVAALPDFPIVIHRLVTRDNGEFGNLDNQAITYLNVEAKSGFAPPRWQSGIGSVIVARKDRKDLSPEHYEAIWMYHDHLLDDFGEEPAPEHLTTGKRLNGGS
ncbi:unnamed protein product [Penicillium pancosmium]